MFKLLSRRFAASSVKFSFLTLCYLSLSVFLFSFNFFFLFFIFKFNIPKIRFRWISSNILKNSVYLIILYKIRSPVIFLSYIKKIVSVEQPLWVSSSYQFLLLIYGGQTTGTDGYSLLLFFGGGIHLRVILNLVFFFKSD